MNKKKPEKTRYDGSATWEASENTMPPSLAISLAFAPTHHAGPLTLTHSRPWCPCHPLLPSLLPGPPVALSDCDAASPPPPPFIRTHKLISRTHCSTITPPTSAFLLYSHTTTFSPPTVVPHYKSQKTEKPREKDIYTALILCVFHCTFGGAGVVRALDLFFVFFILLPPIRFPARASD